MATFTIWEGDRSGVTLSMGTKPPAIDPAASLIKTFEAETWPEANQVLNDRYGWGPYRDDGRWEAPGETPDPSHAAAVADLESALPPDPADLLGWARRAENRPPQGWYEEGDSDGR